MKLIACMNLYNEIEHIERVLTGLHVNGMDHVIALDGAYQGFPHEAWHSTDGTLEVLLRWQQSQTQWLHLIETPPEGWPGQEIKRTKYFRVADSFAEPGDWLVQVDGDEELVGDDADYRGRRFRDFLAEQPEQVTTIYVAIRNWNGDETKAGNWDHWAKVYRWLPGLHYGHEHWDILAGDGRRIWDIGLNYQSPQARVWGYFKFHHWSDARAEARKHAKGQYENFRHRFRAVNGCMNPNPSIEVNV